MKKAFTLLELVIVIVIFGIIASIGSDITMNLYTNYISARNQNEYEEKLNDKDTKLKEVGLPFAESEYYFYIDFY